MTRGAVTAARPALARAAVVLALAATLLVVPACGGGGGGGGGGGPTQPPPPQTPAITFTPSGSAGANSISLERAGGGADRLVLRVRATQVTDLYGVSFDLAFPSTALAFDSATEGPFLAGGGNFQTSMQVAEASPGTLVVGISRLGVFRGATGSGVLLTLEFVPAGTASGGMTFQQNRGFDGDGDVTAVGWVGGSVDVVR